MTVLSGTFPVLKSLGVVEGKDVASAMFPLTSRQANSWSFYSSISTVINEDDARARSIDPVLLQNPCDIIGKLPAEVALVILHHLARCVT